MSSFVSLGWSAISWIEHYLVHGPGDVQGQTVELDDEFAAHILKAYRLDPESLTLFRVPDRFRLGTRVSIQPAG